MNKIITLISLTLILGGCSTAVKTFTDDGKEGYKIDCSGNESSWEECHVKAGSICGSSGYTVHNKDSYQGIGVAGNPQGSLGGSQTSRRMTISCKK